MSFLNNFFVLNKINIKNISYFRSIIRIETFNNSFCDTLGNFLKRVIFLTSNSYKILYLKILNVKSEFYDLPGIKEDTRTIIKNINNIIIKINNSNIANLIFKKIGPCIIKAKDIFSDQNITILNPNKIVATIVNKTFFYCVMKCVNTKIKNYNDDFFKFRIFNSNIIYINDYKSPIININYFINNKIYNKKLKKLFLDIETDGSLKPIDCFKNCIFYIKKYFDLLFNTIGFKKKELLIKSIEIIKTPSLKINPIHLKSINNLKLSVRSSNLLKYNNIFLIGDLVIKKKNDLKKIPGLGLKSYNEILFSLKNFCLSYNLKLNYDL